MNEFTGQVKKAKAGAFKNADVLTKEGDLAFLEKVLLPAFKAHGITSDDDIIMEIGRILTNRTGSSLLSRTYQQRVSLRNQMDANKNAMGIDELTSAADQTLDGKILELKAEWKKLELQMGILLPAVTKVTGWMVDIVKALQLDSNFSDSVGSKVNNAIDHPIKTAFGLTPFGMAIGGVKSFFSGNSGVPPQKQQAVQLNHTTTLDGRVIAHSTADYFLGGLGQAPVSGNNFDARSSLLMAGQ